MSDFIKMVFVYSNKDAASNGIMLNNVKSETDALLYVTRNA